MTSVLNAYRKVDSHIFSDITEWFNTSIELFGKQFFHTNSHKIHLKDEEYVKWKRIMIDFIDIHLKITNQHIKQSSYPNIVNYKIYKEFKQTYLLHPDEIQYILNCPYTAFFYSELEKKLLISKHKT